MLHARTELRNTYSIPHVMLAKGELGDCNDGGGVGGKTVCSYIRGMNGCNLLAGFDLSLELDHM